MNISLTTLSLVAHDAPLRAPHLEKDIEGKVQEFFVDHIGALREMSEHDDAPPPARFIDPEAQELFQTLHMGGTSEFLSSARILTKRLIGNMNKRTTRGLLACVRGEEGGSNRTTAILKLEIDPSNGTMLEELASGDIRLSTVTNVLEQPGDLQKGILVMSDMPAEEVICGDTLSHQARYFPEAFGIQVFARPSRGPSAFLKAVARHDAQLAGPVAAALPRVRPGTPREVVTELADLVPALDPQTQEEIIDTLEQAPRPITRLDTAKQVTAVIEQDGITIKGPAQVISQGVKLRETAEGSWEAVVHFNNPPEIIYR